MQTILQQNTYFLTNPPETVKLKSHCIPVDGGKPLGDDYVTGQCERPGYII